MKLHLSLLLLAAAATLPSAARAQMAPAAPPRVAPGAQVEPSKSFDDMLTGFEKEVVSAAKAMPADKFSFAPTPATFAPGQKTDFATVKTFCQQVTHIADANYLYAAAVGGIKSTVDMKALNAITDKDAAIAALLDSFAFAHKAYAMLTPQNAFESVHGTTTRASLAGGLVAHGFDHYGQMVEYLRMNGIIPPASAK